MLMYLNEHIVDNEEKISNFRGHDEDVEATSWLVKTNTVKLTAELESSWIQIKAQMS